MSNVKIYDPTTAVANPNYDPPSRPARQIFPTRASQFPGNVIPTDRINPLLQEFLIAYVPMPNMMMDGPGAGLQQLPGYSQRDHYQDQGPLRVDHNFAGGDTLLGRYSHRAQKADFLPAAA